MLKYMLLKLFSSKMYVMLKYVLLKLFFQHLERGREFININNLAA